MGGTDAPPQENFVLDPNGAFIDGKMAVVKRLKGLRLG
jgi:hypothetical protein